MKKFSIILATALATAVGAFALLCFLSPGFPLVHLFQSTSVSTVETENKTLQDVVHDVVKQVEVKTGKKVRIIFAPESIANNTKVVFGNPPVEGDADHALCIAACDYHCHVRYIDKNTVLFYLNDGG